MGIKNKMKVHVAESEECLKEIKQKNGILLFK